jgi:hypothetical protein
VTDSLPADLAIFVHLTDEQGNIVAQYDGLDAAVGTLHRDDVFLQRHIIPLPEDLNPGVYSLTLGLYRRDGGERLPLTNGDDLVHLGEIRWVE